MNDQTNNEMAPPIGRFAMILVSLAVLVTFGLIVGSVTWLQRDEIQNRILDRAARSLEQVVSGEYRRAEESALLENAELIEMDLIDLTVSSEQVIDEIGLWCLELPNVQSIAFHDPEGLLRHALPHAADQSRLDDNLLNELLKGEPQAAWTQESSPDLKVFMAFIPEDGSLPTGYASFLLDGTEVEEEIIALDDDLLKQAGTAFGTGGILITAILWFFFNKLRRSSQMLAERSRKLAKANEKLILASKSAALGSVSAHLMHGLKNPLAGLHEFVKDREANDPADEEIRLVSQAARSMQTMVEEALQVLQEHRTEGVSYAFTTKEALDILEKRLGPLAESKGVTLKMPDSVPEASIDNMQANLLVLALFNLGQNAIEVTAEKGAVTFGCELETENQLAFRVSDDGPGLPETMLDAPFAPRPSSKQGGTGVGLAISQQLADLAGAQLSLESNGQDGACFLLLASLEGKQSDS